MFDDAPASERHDGYNNRDRDCVVTFPSRPGSDRIGVRHRARRIRGTT